MTATTKKLTGGIINAMVIGAAADRPELTLKAAEAIDALEPNGDALIELTNGDLANIVRYGGDVATARAKLRAELAEAKSAALIGRVRLIRMMLVEIPPLLEAAEEIAAPTALLDAELEALATELGEASDAFTGFKLGAWA